MARVSVKSRNLDFFLTAGFYFWRETNLAIIFPGESERLNLMQMAESCFIIFMPTVLHWPRALLASPPPSGAKTKDNKKLWAGCWIDPETVCHDQCQMECDVCDASPGYQWSHFTFLIPDQGLRIFNYRQMWSRVPGPGPQPPHSRIRELRLVMRASLGLGSWHLSRSCHLLVCLSVIRLDNGACNAMSGPDSWSSGKRMWYS